MREELSQAARASMTKESVSPRMKVAIVGTVGLPASYGGFETLTQHLVDQLGDHFEFHVYCSANRYDTKPGRWESAILHYIPFDANGISSVAYDTISCLHSIRYADIVLVLGVSGCVFLPIIRALHSGKIIVNVDGVEWRRDKWQYLAKRFLRVSERLAVRFAHIVVADNAEIGNHIESAYGRQPAIIAYGGDHAKRVDIDGFLLEQYPFLETNYAVKVCRIEPENNVHIVLDAFSRLPNVNLVVIGNWKSNRYGLALSESFDKYGNIFILDPIYDSELLDCIRGNGKVYVHGHSAGGTNPSLVEAMSLGLPICAYDVGFNRATTKDQALYFGNADELVDLMENTPDSDWQAIGTTMSSIAEDCYSWQKIASQYRALFEGGVN